MKNGAGPTVAIRTDLDALPVHEETGLPYASTVTTKNDAGQEVSVMHACGHDIHMSTFIGTARALGKLKDKWHGTIIFIGQPAEETVGGARALVEGRALHALAETGLRARDCTTTRKSRPAKSESPKDTATRTSIQLT